MGRLISTRADLEPVNALARDLVEKGTNLEPLLLRVADAIHASNREQFDTQGEGRWPKAAASTLAAKRRKNQPETLLVRTGALRRSLTEANAPGSVLTTRRNGELVVGTSIEYAKNHQLGLGNVPRRVVVEADPELLDQIKAIAMEYISDI